MPGKMARSDPRPSFGLPELLVAIHTSRQSCCKGGKARIFHASSGVIRGISVEAVAPCRASSKGDPHEIIEDRRPGCRRLAPKVPAPTHP
jgi:hypothetical protein